MWLTYYLISYVHNNDINNSNMILITVTPETNANILAFICAYMMFSLFFFQDNSLYL